MSRKDTRAPYFPVLAVLAAFFFGLLVQPGTASAARPAGPMWADGEILVKFKPGAASANAAGVHMAAGSSVMKRYEIVPGLERVRLRRAMTVEQAVALYSANPLVEYAEPNYVVHAAVTSPNDPKFHDAAGPANTFDDQWALYNVGQNINGTIGTAGADISARQAWDLRTASTVIVAVIDSGIDYNHPDIAANMWTNPGEIQGNSIDDDGNGYIDDYYGINALTTASTCPSPTPCSAGDPMDDFDHGTHVAGIIGAVGNNGVGITGVAWSTKLMAVKFLNSLGTGTVGDAIEGIQYAISKGAKVINASYGHRSYSASEYTAVSSAMSSGILFVAAAGNWDITDTQLNNDALPYYPASLPQANVVAVAATDNNDALASYSHYGATTVDLGAPGDLILSTVPTAITPSGYALMSGTSMAAPHVSGAASLIFSANAALTYADVKSLITSGVDAKAALAGKTATGGRLNLFTSLTSANVQAPSALAAASVSASRIDLSWTDNSTGETGFKVERKTGAGGYAQVGTTAANATTYSDTDATLSSCTEYFYRVRAYNSLVNSPYSAEAYATTGGCTLTAPSGLGGVVVSSTAVDLTWVDNSTGETGFRVERKEGRYGTYALAATTAANATAYSDTGLTACTNYYYRVKAYSGAGTSAPSNEVSLTTSGCPADAPTGLSATAVSRTEIDLVWTDTSATETGFKIERKTGAAGTYAEIAVVGANVTSYIDLNRKACTQYYYRVRSYNGVGDSAYSNETNATTTGCSSGGGGGGGGGCFIATAAYGTSLAEEVRVLRKFRDGYLLTNGPGRLFVEYYYLWSPPAADYISTRPVLRLAARGALTPVVYAVKYPFFTALLIPSVGVIAVLTLRRRKR